MEKIQFLYSIPVTARQKIWWQRRDKKVQKLVEVKTKSMILLAHSHRKNEHFSTVTFDALFSSTLKKYVGLIHEATTR
jgi:hypothetical protein